MKIIGHRGSKGEEPENTILSFMKAIENKVDGIELDVHLSKDQELVIMHDDTLNRTTNGKGKIADYTLSELKKFDAGKGEKIPTLQEVIDLVKEKNIEVFIEIKCDNAEEKIAESINKNDLFDLAVVKSFNHRYVKKIKEINENIKTGCLIIGLPIHAYKILEDARAEILSLNFDFVDEELIKECHIKGYKVFIWNVDEKENLKKYTEMGADYIGTNFPSKIKS